MLEALLAERTHLRYGKKVLHDPTDPLAICTFRIRIVVFCWGRRASCMRLSVDTGVIYGRAEVLAVDQHETFHRINFAKSVQPNQGERSHTVQFVWISFHFLSG